MKDAENSWILFENKKPETHDRVLICFKNRHNEKNPPYVTIATYIAPRSVNAEDFLDDECCDSFYESDYEESTDIFWTPDGFYETLWEPDINIFVSNTVTHWKVIDQPPVI